jgi:hypothetical protein
MGGIGGLLASKNCSQVAQQTRDIALYNLPKTFSGKHASPWDYDTADARERLAQVPSDRNGPSVRL